LDVDGDGHGVLTTSDSESDLILDIADLATTYLGPFTFANLAQAGRVGECRPGAVADADRLFATATAPWSSTMF
jgi:predicted acetyltransferase